MNKKLFLSLLIITPHLVADDSDLVLISSVDPSIPTHLTGKHGDGTTQSVVFPDCAEAYLREKAARSLADVQAGLKAMLGDEYTLVTASAYYPLSIYRRMYEEKMVPANEAAKPSRKVQLVAPEDATAPKGLCWCGVFINPKEIDISTPEGVAAAKALFPPLGLNKARVRPDYNGSKVSQVQRKNLKILIGLMRAAGWEVDQNMWSQFHYKGYAEMPQTLDQPFESLAILNEK